jgi:hypothetical protein
MDRIWEPVRDNPSILSCNRTAVRQLLRVTVNLFPSREYHILGIRQMGPVNVQGAIQAELNRSLVPLPLLYSLLYRRYTLV